MTFGTRRDCRQALSRACVNGSYEVLSQRSFRLRLVELLRVLVGTLVAIALKTHTVGGEEDIFPKRGPEVLPGVLYCKCEFRVRSGPHSYQNLNFRLVLYETMSFTWGTLHLWRYRMTGMSS